MILDGLKDKVYNLAEKTLSENKTPEHVERAMNIVALYTELDSKSDNTLKITVEQQLDLQTKLYKKIEVALDMAKESLSTESLDRVKTLMKALRYII